MGKLYRFTDQQGWVYWDAPIDPEEVFDNLRPPTRGEWLWHQITTPRFSWLTYILANILAAAFVSWLRVI